MHEAVERTPLAVDRHLRVGGQAQVLRGNVSKPSTGSAPKRDGVGNVGRGREEELRWALDLGTGGGYLP